MDGNQKAQNFDSRTLALLNRLASRRQSTPNPSGQRPDSAKVESTSSNNAVAAARNSSSSPGLRVGTPIDLSGRGGLGGQRPASAARTQQFGLQRAQNGERSGLISSGMNVQGRLFNMQMGGARLGAQGQGIMPEATGVKQPGSLGLGKLGQSEEGVVRTSSDQRGGRRNSTDGEGGEDGNHGSGGSGSGGFLVISRSKDEKFANPERLNLDRRKLTQCPILEGEERLRLLNYQNNLISRVEHLDNLPNLIFLDLYNNQLRAIESLSHVTTLRVLMLGKNQLDRIQGLETLTRLDVLDLHSNHIQTVEHLNHLPELRVLNLAGNQIHTVENLEGLASLTELNLRRNQITTVRSLDTLPALQRVFISNNFLSSFESLSCIFQTKSLLELALDGNKIASEGGYRQVVLDNLKSLRHLDLKRVTEEERRLASVQARKVEERMQVEMRKEQAEEERQEAIRLARSDWEAAARSARGSGQHDGGAEERAAGGTERRTRGFADVSGTPGVDQKVHVYGAAVDAVERAGPGVVSVHLQYVPMSRAGAAVQSLSGLSSLSALTLSHNDARALPEINAVAALQTLQHLAVTDNPICHSALLRPYVVFRLPRLERFNDTPVTDADRAAAQERFGPLAKMYGKHVVQGHQQNNPRFALSLLHYGLDNIASLPSLRTVLGSAYRPTTAAQRDHAQAASQVVRLMLAEGAAAGQCLDSLHAVWPGIVQGLVEATLAELEDQVDLVQLIE